MYYYYLFNKLNLFNKILLVFLGYLILNGTNVIIYLALFISMVFLAIVKYLTILI
jgi:hypothetical protein